MLSSLSSRSARRCTPAVIGSAIILILAAACASGRKAGTPSPPIVNAPVPAVATSSAAASPTALSGPPDDSPLVQFRMHGAKDGNGKPFDVTAKIVDLGIDPATNTMQSPDNKDDVGYYNFSSAPGSPCKGPDQCANTVVSGHVDWYSGGPGGGPSTGVFWDLRYLQNGDEVDLKLQDGRVYTYKVVANTVYQNDDAPIQQIIGPTPESSVTLITCDGDFNQGEYNSRRVVRAVQTSS